jgi:hypothetical protein
MCCACTHSAGRQLSYTVLQLHWALGFCSLHLCLAICCQSHLSKVVSPHETSSRVCCTFEVQESCRR